MPPPLLIDPASIDTSPIVFDRETIRSYNPQRHEMEQLDAIVYLDTDDHFIIGYKDVTEDEFWVRGHMPDYPLMPGVVMCEVAAQLSSCYCKHYGLLGDRGFIGFGGMEEVRFRGQVRPGDRLIVVGKGIRISKRQTIFDTQSFVDGSVVFQAKIIGVPIINRTAAEAAQDAKS